MRSSAEVQALCDKGAFPLYSGGRLAGAFEAAHAEDANLTAEVLLENLAAKVTAAHSLSGLLKQLQMNPGDIDYVISCSEEAVGDRYNRGGGNLAKAIAEEVGCEQCVRFGYEGVLRRTALRNGSRREPHSLRSLSQRGVVAGGSLAKLGMKSESHSRRICRFWRTCSVVLRCFFERRSGEARHEARLRSLSSRGRRRFAPSHGRVPRRKATAKLGMRLPTWTAMRWNCTTPKLPCLREAAMCHGQTI